MSDGNASWQPSSVEQSDRPNRGAVVAGAAVATVVLATIGAIGGWALAKNDSAEPLNQAGGPSATATAVTAEPSPSKTSKPRPSTSTPSAGKTTASVPAGQFELPDLTGQGFERVRQDLRDRELGWQLIFGKDGENPAVLRTDPPAGANVRKGTTVKVFVAGAAPLTDVPEVTALSCNEAKARLVDAGFEPVYPSGKSGLVVRQEPRPGAQLRWNEKVVIYCGNVPNQPTPAA
ncbi:PASTA domain-containing protein [Micromonospora pisi]|uniref:PASTA domain-containing protein n=1 Tax=Micromonospora pisi TaxID=589240 RepID=A0A495JKL0_9ACTN|nr:PASTA domain-containing protein [Micromonospora pisi]RKR89215.1 PASTA domain-containing protein [Micromonospora pisi]